MPNPDGFKGLEQKDLAPVNPETANIAPDADAESTVDMAKAKLEKVMTLGQ